VICLFFYGITPLGGEVVMGWDVLDVEEMAEYHLFSGGDICRRRDYLGSGYLIFNFTAMISIKI
jgi:hypothetical protein